MTALKPPAAVSGEEARRRALIPPDCWRDAIRSAATVAGVLGVALAALAVLVATAPLGAWLLNVSQGSH